MAKIYSEIFTKRLNMNLPLEIDNRINNYRKYYGFNKTNAIISLLNKSLELFECERLDQEYRNYKKDKCNYNIVI